MTAVASQAFAAIVDENTVVTRSEYLWLTSASSKVDGSVRPRRLGLQDTELDSAQAPVAQGIERWPPEP